MIKKFLSFIYEKYRNRMIVEKITLKKSTTEKMFNVLCSYLKVSDRFVSAKKKNGVWVVKVKFKDKKDYQDFMNQKLFS